MKTTSFWVDIVQTIVISLSLYMVIHLFLVQPNKVDGNSMFPNFHTHERVLTDKISYRFAPPKRGDVVIFTPPEGNNGDFIKRIIALPDETISLQNAEVYIDGNVLSEPYLPIGTKSVERAFLREGQPYHVPPGQYMVFGDNRNFSSDSREWGPILRSAIIGRVWVRYWPPETFGVIN